LIGPDYYVYSDWPIPEDLSYTDTDLMTGGTNGFPVGDLNWFPTQKAAWEAQKDAEHAKLYWMLDKGTLSVPSAGTLPEAYALDQNYPNPFNPSTTISFSLPHASNVSLKVFDILGQEVATLVTGDLTAGKHEVQFDGKGLASGTYMYRLTSGDFTQAKKMMVVK
jgi:Secretion system C-terminal sorting domain